MELGPGTFYLFCPQRSLGLGLFGSLGRTISFGRSSSSEKSTQDRIGALIRRSSLDRDSEKLAKTDGPLESPTWNSSPSTWSLPGGAALVVNFGLFEVVGDLRRVQPSIYHLPEHTAVCVFQGYLSNLDELMERYSDPAEGPWGSPNAVAASGRDAREAAAQVIHRMCARGDDPLVVLSELQGQYAFAMYDGERRQLLAARDGSGREPLFYSVDDDGGASISNAQLAVAAPDGAGNVPWLELPPGYYLTGRTPKLQQFALTPAQLSEREQAEAADDDLSPRGCSAEGSRSFNEELGELTIAD